MSQDMLNDPGLEEVTGEQVIGGIIASSEYFLVNPAGTVLNRMMLSGLFN